MSYAELEGVQLSDDSEGEDEYSIGQDVDFVEEDEFRPLKRSKGSKHHYGRKPSYGNHRVSVHLLCWTSC